MCAGVGILKKLTGAGEGMRSLPPCHQLRARGAPVGPQWIRGVVYVFQTRVLNTRVSYTLCVRPDLIRKVKVAHYSVTERRVSERIPVLGSQPAGDVSHKPGGRLPLLSARPAVTLATLKRAATNFAAW